MGDWITLNDIRVGSSFFWNLPFFLRNRIELEEARAAIRQRLENRGRDFLSMLKGAAYENQQSPYKRLLDLAGCEYGDLKNLVLKDGIEEALSILLHRGVYLTLDEFKGRQPVVRGNTTFTVEPSQLCSPHAARHFVARSGGSRGTNTPLAMDLACVRDHGMNLKLSLNARDASNWLHAHWGVPGGAAMRVLIRFRKVGAFPVRWFSQLSPKVFGVHSRYVWGARLMRWASLLAGVPLPSPEYVPLDNAVAIVLWMKEALNEGRTPHLDTYPSAAVRLCLLAVSAGIDLSGVKLSVSGEPLTAARMAAIRRAGADVVSYYSHMEAGGRIGEGCSFRAEPDDVHLFHDLYALVQPKDESRRNHATLFLSSLRPTSPFLLLNVSLGDRGILTERQCGCPLEAAGWKSHLHTIRSDQKITAGGITFLDTDFISLLEEVLPSCFGGAATHYQLVEDEDSEGRSTLRLLIHPTIGPLNLDDVTERFLDEVGKIHGSSRIIELLWRQTKMLRVERKPPLATSSGKILHLLAGQQSQTSG